MKTRTDKSVSHQRAAPMCTPTLATSPLMNARQGAARHTIAEILAERGYTQTKAAALLGIPAAKLSKDATRAIPWLLRTQADGLSDTPSVETLILSSERRLSVRGRARYRFLLHS